MLHKDSKSICGSIKRLIFIYKKKRKGEKKGNVNASESSSALMPTRAACAKENQKKCFYFFQFGF